MILFMFGNLNFNWFKLLQSFHILLFIYFSLSAILHIPHNLRYKRGSIIAICGHFRENHIEQIM